MGTLVRYLTPGERLIYASRRHTVVLANSFAVFVATHSHLLQSLLDLGEDVLDRAVRGNADEDAAEAVVLDQRLGLLVVELQPRPNRLGRVVDPAFVVSAPRQALDAHLFGKLELEDDVERPLDLLEHRVERLGLHGRAGKAVEDESPACVLLAEAVPDELDHQVVGNESAGVVDRPHAPSHLGAGGHRSPEDVSRRDVRDAVLRGDELALGSFAGALGPKQQNVEHYLRKPS